MKNVLIDTDPGMDDALAIILALKSRELRTLGISAATGNLPVGQDRRETPCASSICSAATMCP